MIAALYNKHIYLRIATGIFLVMLIMLKTAAPIFVSLKSSLKENSSLTENDNNGEKKAENNASIEKEKEFTNAGNTRHVPLLWYAHITHITCYHNNYQTTHFLKVASPPPDSYLQPIC